MTTKISEMSIKQIAQEEIDTEDGEKNLSRYKSLFRRLKAAKKIVANIEREIEDLEVELDLD